VSVRVWKVDRDEVLSRLRTWAAGLVARPEVLAAVLFGSFARGDATPASDADVLLLLCDSTEAFRDRLVSYKPVGLGVSVEVFPHTVAEARTALTEGWGVVGVALREGVVLFVRDGFEDVLAGWTEGRWS
jgi:predicted nucleotidyltransferase